MTRRRPSSSSISSGYPKDVEAKRGLAGAYRGAGKVEQAQALEKELVAAGGAPSAAGAPTASQDLMSIGVNFYNEKKYAGRRGGVREGGRVGALQPGCALEPE